MCSDGVDEQGIPVVEISPEMLQEEERRPAVVARTESPIGVADSVGRFDRDVRSRQL